MGNISKTGFLLIVLTLILIYLGKLIGGGMGMQMALGLAIIMNLVTYWFSDKIVLAMYRAKQVGQTEVPELYRTVADLAQQANLPMPKLYIMDTPTPNAFATGRNPHHAAVAVTEGILHLLNKEELKGVLAHELAHVKNRDILISSIVAVIAGTISMIADMARWASIFGGFRDEDNRSNPIAFLAMAIIAPLAAFMIQMAISRTREYEADSSGAQICGNPMVLANALRKLHKGVQQIPMAVNPSTAHMFIVSPLTGGGLLTLFSTHPPIEKRIERLERMLYNS